MPDPMPPTSPIMETAIVKAGHYSVVRYCPAVHPPSTVGFAMLQNLIRAKIIGVSEAVPKADLTVTNPGRNIGQFLLPSVVLD